MLWIYRIRNRREEETNRTLCKTLWNKTTLGNLPLQYWRFKRSHARLIWIKKNLRKPTESQSWFLWGFLWLFIRGLEKKNQANIILWSAKSSFGRGWVGAVQDLSFKTGQTRSQKLAKDTALVFFSLSHSHTHKSLHNFNPTLPASCSLCMTSTSRSFLKKILGLSGRQTSLSPSPTEIWWAFPSFSRSKGVLFGSLRPGKAAGKRLGWPRWAGLLSEPFHSLCPARVPEALVVPPRMPAVKTSSKPFPPQPNWASGARPEAHHPELEGCRTMCFSHVELWVPSLWDQTGLGPSAFWLLLLLFFSNVPVIEFISIFFFPSLLLTKWNFIRTALVYIMYVKYMQLHWMYAYKLFIKQSLNYFKFADQLFFL